ncbi:TPA: hypothetical protein NG675_003482 [Vibrio parahaemolyticus]|uniref:hypothetical protein n=1 Tax=Vibrio parahaemolyticus TaxID=670 RepID=UPI0006A6C45F|nr:hypothetical protein [Vibrio parahaemolyticus]EIZ1367925.1 hypothetical protein [Vibrio parahaemolyticus]EKO5223692.1 hypothetical protein [Vibrio parahaemolyticus]KOE12957.1 hypothetical protein ACS85_10180 [Vibrio parahaemolyticus]MCG6461549.1 hypothetical protein [Vibrio parahaemolyticus]MDF4376419.1 hypothetical protein [Vibrio parahaemolyticus]
MKVSKEQQRIKELETALAEAELQIERLTEYNEPTISTITVKPVELTSFKQHSRAIDDEIASSNYLSTSVTDALSELRWMVIHCNSLTQSIEYEKQLMRSKAATVSDTYVGQLARDVAKKSVLGSKVATQLSVFNALFELDRVQEEMNVSNFTDDLLKHDATSILNSSTGKLSDLVALRKARMNGSFEQIEQVIDKILGEED